jgi:short subunit dehydrogenase-like uncharacterized protein
MASEIQLYWATGYTGKLIAAAAHKQGPEELERARGGANRVPRECAR